MKKLYQELKKICKTRYGYMQNNDTVPFLCYHEFGRKYLKCDNISNNTVNLIQIDYYTELGGDINVEKIEEILNNLSISFSYSAIFDIDDKLYHHIFECEAIKDGIY